MGQSSGPDPHLTDDHHRGKMSHHELYRVTLNDEPLKELVVLSRGQIDDPVVQIIKDDEIQGQFDWYELRELLRHPTTLKNIVSFMSEETPPSLIHKFEITLHHEIFFSFLRDKPFLAITATGPYREHKGIPVFETCHLGQTAWHAICRHKKAILYTMARHAPHVSKAWATSSIAALLKQAKANINKIQTSAPP